VIESVLVANRGEIAVRIFATCRRLGIRTIAVFSDADAQAQHVAEADEAYRIGPPPATESYLNQAVILEAAKRSNAAAIHPGYGFLAENPDFAQAVLDAGLIWVGPSPAAMRALGDKAHAKALAEHNGVPVLPGFHGSDQSSARLAHAAATVGYPVLIKAAAGGGGRGMRVVDSAAEFAAALEAARREARAAFGDDRVLVERFVRRPRHVEVQILGDRGGSLIHLGERECSIQRRHQKLIEESPSPAVDADLRARMGEAALRLARAAGYTNAGTVEFLLDGRGEFAFLEVNARLQVEHPVTEQVTALDLVELQLRIAAGEPLPVAQDEVHFDGHAIEARVIAEDPLAGFLPSSGTVGRFEYPSFIRTDSWVRAGTHVSPYYDSLLAKVIAHGSNRTEAMKTLAHALQEVWIDGVADNVDLLLATVEHPAFVRGDLHTGFLDEHSIIESLADVPPPVIAAAAAADFVAPPARDQDPWRGQSAWRLGRLHQPAIWSRAHRAHSASVSADLDGDGLLVHVGPGDAARASPADANVAGVFRVRGLGGDDQRRRVGVDGIAATVWDHGTRRVVEWSGRSFRLHRSPPPTLETTAGDRGHGGSAGRLTAPMPARVVKIAVAAGEHVSHNQPLMVLEAMKMEHVVEAPHSGVVTELCVRIGDQVAGGAQLLTLGSAEDGQTVE
jgi:3-methylcrotonyl-CoA carboxylase alpha subunit